MTAIDSDELPWISIRTASKDQYSQIRHPGVRYVVNVAGQAPGYYARFAEAKAAADALVGSPVRWQKRTYLNGRQMSSEWTPVAKEVSQ